MADYSMFTFFGCWTCGSNIIPVDWLVTLKLSVEGFHLILEQLGEESDPFRLFDIAVPLLMILSEIVFNLSFIWLTR